MGNNLAKFEQPGQITPFSLMLSKGIASRKELKQCMKKWNKLTRFEEKHWPLRGSFDAELCDMVKNLEGKGTCNTQAQLVEDQIKLMTTGKKVRRTQAQLIKKQRRLAILKTLKEEEMQEGKGTK